MTEEHNKKEEDQEKINDNKIDRRKFIKVSGQVFGIMMTAGFFGFENLINEAKASKNDFSNELIILHTNDIHGRIEEDNNRIGMAKTASLIEEYRNFYDNVLVLDAGDTIHGMTIVNELEGLSAVETMNIAGYDIMVPGNHDFNFGYQRLLELEEMMEFELISANIYKDGELLFKPYTIKEFNDFTVGVFGLTTPYTEKAANPRYVRGLEFTNMAQEAKKYVDILNEKNVDIIIALGHVGLDGDYPSTDVLDEVNGIDIFVDGHSHHRLPEGKFYNETMIVQAYEYLKYIGKVDVNFSDDKKSIIPSLISADEAKEYPKNSEIEELLEQAEKEAYQNLF